MRSNGLMWELALRATGWLGVMAVIGGLSAHAQPASLMPGVYQDTLRIADGPVYQLRPFIIQGSFLLRQRDTIWPDSSYSVDYRSGSLLLATVPADTAAIVATYRTLSYPLRGTYRRRRFVAASETDSLGRVSVVEERGAGGPYDPFAGTSLQRSGSITRGIQAGNNRDVTVESGLNLQLSGEVAEGVRVQAVLTDENTPIQPEGTTQRLEEFDRVFIQIEAPRGTAQLGDFDLALHQSAFARFQRKLQGITVFGPIPDVRGRLVGGGSATVAGATSRGIFRSQTIQPLEGIQGPYRLEGQNGERFIIVLPGSEQVYLDGALLTRGETNDYIIDYQTGEITFTARRLMAPDRRVVAEYQYTTNQFTRTLVGTEVATGLWQRPDGSARFDLGVTYLREADASQFSDEFGITALDSSLIAAAGDGLAFRGGEELVPYDPEAIFVQYTQEVVSANDGEPDTIFVAIQGSAPPTGTPVFRVRFSRVGAGQGRYVRVGQAVNGILYEYQGAGRGDYEPVRLLPKPRRQQLFDLRGRLEPVRGLRLFAEWARSLTDENRLSLRDQADDLDDALLVGLQLAPRPIGNGTIEASMERRHVGRNFKAFDRIRPVEFARTWNLPGAVPATTNSGVGAVALSASDETTDELSVVYRPRPQHALRAEAGRIDLGSFTGQRGAVEVNAEPARGPSLTYRAERIHSEDLQQLETGTWARQRGDLRKPLAAGRLVPFIGFEQENRRQKVLGTDSLTQGSEAFLELRPGVAWSSDRVELTTELERRSEARWQAGQLRPASTAWTLQSRIAYHPDGPLQSDGTLGYRVRSVKEGFSSAQDVQGRESVVVQWTGAYRPAERAVDVSWLYDAQTERTPTLQEIYVRVGPDRGAFVWEDANGDGVIQVDEFLPERTPNEGLYFQTFVPSDSLTNVISVQARLRLRLDASRLWRQAEARWKRMLAQIQSHTIIEVREKNRTPNLSEIYLLQLSRFRDPVNTVNGRLRLGQDVFLFRRNPAYGLDLSINRVASLIELAAGEEARRITSARLDGNYRLARRLRARLRVTRERNAIASDSLSSRQYNIESRKLEPEVSYQPSAAFRATLGLAWAVKQDAVGDRRAQVYQLPFQLSLQRARAFQVALRVEVAQVKLDGQASGLAEFELTEGRGPGRSSLWQLSGNYRLSSLFTATFSYDGRAPADAPTLHTFRVQFSALF